MKYLTVVNPIQKARKPMSRLDTMSKLTPYFKATTCRPGVTIGPRLKACQWEHKISFSSGGSIAYAVVTPELNARIIMIDSFHAGDLVVFSERLYGCE